MAFLPDGGHPSADRLGGAVRRLYAACHLRAPLVVTARNAVEFTRICSALTARTGNRQSLVVFPLSILSLVFMGFLTALCKGLAGPPERLGTGFDAWTVLMVMSSLFLFVFLSVAMGDRTSEAVPDVRWRCAAMLLTLTVTILAAGVLMPGPPAVAVLTGTLASFGIALAILGSILLWPVWRRREIAADLDVRLPLRGAEPIRDVVEPRLASALLSVRNLPAPDPSLGMGVLEASRRAVAADIIDDEGQRLAVFWRDIRPVLGRASRSGPAREVTVLALAKTDERTLPAVLAAAVELDRLTDALCVFNGVAVILPANAPLTYPAERLLPEPGRDRHAAVFDWIGYRGPLAAAMPFLPPRLGDRLLARYVVRIPEAGRRTGAIKAFGAERFFAALAARPVQEDRFGRLHLVGSPNDPSVFVEVVDVTIAPDGSRRCYWLSVPPHVATAHEAVAATFGKTAGTYDPTTQS